MAFRGGGGKETISVVAEKNPHQGQIEAGNRSDRPGVVFTVTLPLRR